ncbi:MAG: hypothetical protein GVY05_09600 [Bacteroidetes bacterium]|jgi:hypothetical protein|nr:hypothetical protein [Bacteroidota bacterium]
MKKITINLLLAFGFGLLIACSSDDDSNTESNITGNFFPLVVNNSWDYENTLSSSVAGQDDIVTTETLSITGTTENSGNTVYELDTDNPAGSSPVTLALSQGVLRKNDASLIYTGQFGLGLTDFPEINFDVENVQIYDTSASLDTELFSQDGSIQQEFQGLPLSINYTLSSIMGDSFESFESNDVTYDNVISSQLIINLEITANITDPLPLNIPILQSQDAVVVTNYFADGVGLVQSETDTNFVFEDIPIPDFTLEDISLLTLQELVNYSVELE